MTIAAGDNGASHLSRRVEIAVGGLAALVSIAIASTALLASRRFFLTDDYATQFMPVFREIARLLGDGHFPFLTDRLWSGGALLQEYQYAVLNPVSLALYAGLGRIDDLALAAAIFSLVHIGVFAGGTYLLCRALGCAPRHAFLAAAVAPLSDWIFYWGATNWIPALVSLSWLTWAWGFLVLTATRPAFAPAAAVAVAMTLLSGWPFANLALLISVVAATDLLSRPHRTQPLRPAAWVAFALITGGLLAAPAILPLALYVSHGSRPAAFNGWAAELPALLGAGVPYFITHWTSFAGDIVPVPQSMVYAAWFAPLALANADWTRLVKSRAGLLMTLAATGYAVVSMLPAILLFRWMFRLLPYYQLAVLILASLALTGADEQGRIWRINRIRWVVVAEVGLAFCLAPSFGRFFLAIGLALFLCGWIGARLLVRRDLSWIAFALAVSVAIFELTLWMTASGGYPKYPNTWSPPTTSLIPSRASASGPTRYAIVDRLSEADPGPAYWSAYTPANISLERSGIDIGGYTPLIVGGFLERFCVYHVGVFCPDPVARITTPAPPTGRSVIDLASVDEVIIQNKSHAAAFRAAAGAGWREARGAAGEWRFTRLRPLGLVSWTSPGLGVAAVSRTPARIVADVRNDSPSPGTMVLARAWYPGWSARLNGAAVPVTPLAGLLVSIQVPPHGHGRLEVSFWPSGLTAGLILAALGALLLGVAALRPRLIDGPAAWLGSVLGTTVQSAEPEVR